MNLVTRMNQFKYEAFRWRYELSLPRKLALALGMAAITGLLAQVRLPLPWSPVPVTGQTLAVLLAGLLVGRWWGGVSMALYASLGILGVPWFNGFTSGFGATGGYIIGFILAGLFMGHFADGYIRSHRLVSLLGLMLFANLVLVYVPGLVWLHYWLGAVKGAPADLLSLLGMGAIPFLAGDLTKAVLAAVIARVVTPRQSS